MKTIELTSKIIFSLFLGVITGIFLQNNQIIAVKYIAPFGTIYLNLIKFILVPIVLCTITQGIISLGDIRKIEKCGVFALVFYIITTFFASTLGILFANIFNVGAGYILDNSIILENTQVINKIGLVDAFVNIFPSNVIEPLLNASMIQIIFIAFIFSFGILSIGEKGKTLISLIDSFTEICFFIMTKIINMSYIGVFALIVPVVALNGVSVILPLSKLILVMYLTSFFHILIVYPLMIKLFSKTSPIYFFREMKLAMLFAFSSASSVGALPFNIKAAKKLGVDESISSFVLPLGATINMDGAAIYQSICACFAAQIFGIELTIINYITIVVIAMLVSIGSAGVPGSGILMLSVILQSVGLPMEVIVLVSGIDRVLDMARTVVNITGDAACTICVDAMEKKSAKSSSSYKRSKKKNKKKK